ncbi:MAG: ATP-binding cassette domain-containing protein, partial [Allorhizobium sp.]
MTGTAPAALDVHDIHKSFAGIEVLKGISAKAQRGDVISIIGSSGSGKSTFLRCINLLEAPDRGRIVVGGEELKLRPSRKGSLEAADRKQLERLRTGLGMVFQSFNLWAHRTVLENVIEAPVHVLKVPHREAVEKAEALLAKVGLYDKRDAYPAFLSGGQQQRAGADQPVALRMDPAHQHQRTVRRAERALPGRRLAHEHAVQRGAAGEQADFARVQ